MTNEIKKQKETINLAYVAGRDAIVKQLGKDAPRELILDVVMLMAHSLLTDNGVLGLAIANHNVEFFCDQLKTLVESSQREVTSKSYCSRMM